MLKSIWPTKKLGEIARVFAGSSAPQGVHYFSNGKCPFVRVSDLGGAKNKNLVDVRDQINDLALSELRPVIAKKGTIVFPKSGAAIATNARAILGVDAYIVSHLAGIEADTKKVLTNWLYLFLFDFDMTKLSANSAYPSLQLARIKEIQIPLPKIGEQRKIVAKIEKLFAKIDEAQKLREESKKSAFALLQSALNEIFSKPKAKFWTEKRISDLALEIKSGFACGKSNEVADGVIHLRTHNIDLSGEINLQKIVRMPQKMVDSDVYNLKKGDLVFNNTNSAELVGKTIIIRENLPYAFSNHLTRIRFDKNLIIPEWALIIFKKYWQEKYFESTCTRWVGQAGINQTNLGKIKIPLPPIAEQKKIVVYLDSFSEKVHELQKFQDETKKDLADLKQSILQKSFSGKLLK